jgi:uncharacterized protein
MLIADVSVYLYAHRPESPRHDEHKSWLEDALSGQEPFGVSELALAGFVRIATNHRVYKEPATPTQALEFCDAVVSAPAAVPLRAGARHWQIFRQLVEEVGARGNVVPDAFHAALAIENAATWITHDAGFARFPGLKWQRPLSPEPVPGTEDAP